MDTYTQTHKDGGERWKISPALFLFVLLWKLLKSPSCLLSRIQISHHWTRPFDHVCIGRDAWIWDSCRSAFRLSQARRHWQKGLKKRSTTVTFSYGYFYSLNWVFFTVWRGEVIWLKQTWNLLRCFHIETASVPRHTHQLQSIIWCIILEYRCTLVCCDTCSLHSASEL